MRIIVQKIDKKCTVFNIVHYICAVKQHKVTKQDDKYNYLSLELIPKYHERTLRNQHFRPYY